MERLLREKYETLKLGDLRDIAKKRGIKGASGMKKSEIIDLMCEMDEKEAANAAPARKAVQPASHGTAFQAAGSNNPLIPRAWPSVTKSKALQAFCPSWHFQAPSNLILL